MNESDTVRQEIEKKIADWDMAYAQKDVYGYLGHLVPESRESEQAGFQSWANVMSISELLEAKSVITGFTLEGDQAKVVTQVREKMVVLRPEEPVRKFLFGWLTNFVFVTQDIRHSIWVKTAEGWLCKSDETISTRVRLKRRGAV